MAVSDKKPAAPAADKKDTKTPKERMTSVGVNRVNNVLHALQVLENVADRATYEYTDAQADKIISTIKSAVAKVDKRFNDAKAGVVHKPVKEGFAL